jgi:hypothetical protein
MTHHEYTEKVKPYPPCNASNLTFGGRCLNCGYDPALRDRQHRAQVSISNRLKSVTWMQR